jgi:type II secretion system protein N
MHSKKTLLVAGYIGFGLLTFLASLYLTFPAEALAQRLTQELRRRSGGQWQAAYTQAATYRLSGLALTGVTFTHLAGPNAAAAPADGSAPAASDAQQSFKVDSLRARLRLLPLLLGHTGLQAQAQLHNGWLSATVTPQGTGMTVEAQAKDIDLATPPLLAQFVGLPVGGKLNGSLEGRYDLDPKKMNAQLDLQLDTATVGSGAVAGFSLPNVEVGQITLAAEIKEGKLKVTQFKQMGGNVSLQANASATVRNPVDASVVDVCFKVRADPLFLSNNPKIKTALQLAEVQIKKDPEGYLNLPLTGPLNAMHIGNTLCR